MKTTLIIWDMPVTVEIVDKTAGTEDIENVFSYFKKVDDVFNIYNPQSEISRINEGLIAQSNYSRDMKEVMFLCGQTKKETMGYFDINFGGNLNPLGIVKGWAVKKAADMLKAKGLKNFYIDAGGDVEIVGSNGDGNKWKVGIRNPFNRKQNVKVLHLTDKGIATSGTYIRGEHIIDPLKKTPALDLLSMTVIADNIYEADRFATAAFAMGKKGIEFVAKKGLEGYAIDNEGVATYTAGFSNLLTDQ